MERQFPECPDGVSLWLFSTASVISLLSGMINYMQVANHITCKFGQSWPPPLPPFPAHSPIPELSYSDNLTTKGSKLQLRCLWIEMSVTALLLKSRAFFQKHKSTGYWLFLRNQCFCFAIAKYGHVSLVTAIPISLSVRQCHPKSMAPWPRTILESIKRLILTPRSLFCISYILSFILRNQLGRLFCFS